MAGKKKKRLGLEDVVKLDGIGVAENVEDHNDAVVIADHDTAVLLTAKAHNRKHYKVDKITIKHVRHTNFSRGDVKRFTVEFDEFIEEEKKGQTLVRKRRTRSHTVRLSKADRTALRKLAGLPVKEKKEKKAKDGDGDATDTKASRRRAKRQAAVITQPVDLTVDIQDRLEREINRRKIARTGGILLGMAPLVLFGGRFANVLFDGTHTQQAAQELQTQLPNPEFAQLTKETAVNVFENMGAIGSNVWDAAGAMAPGWNNAVDDLGQSLSAIGDMVENTVTAPWRDWQEQGGTLLGTTAVQDHLLELHRQANAGGFITFAGEPEELGQYRDIYTNLAVLRADGSVRFHDQIDRPFPLSAVPFVESIPGMQPTLVEFAATARDAGYDPAMALALAHIIHTRMLSPATLGDVEGELRDIGANYLVHANGIAPTTRTADTDLNLQLLAAARIVVGGIADGPVRRAPRDVSLTDGAILELATTLVSKAEEYQGHFVNQHTTAFNASIIDQSYHQMAGDPALLQAFLSTDAVGLGPISGQALGNAMMRYDHDTRADIVAELMAAAPNLLRPIQEVRQEIRERRENSGVIMLNNFIQRAGALIGLARNVTERVERPHVNLSSTAVTLAALARHEAGSALLSQLVTRAPDNATMAEIARTGTADDINAAVMLRALQSDRSILTQLGTADNGTFASEIALQRLARSELQDAAVSLMSDRAGGESIPLLLRGSIADGGNENVQQLASRYVDVLAETSSFCRATDTTTVSGRLRQQLTNLYGFDDTVCGGLMMYLSANEGNINPYNPPILSANGRGLQRRIANGCPRDYNLARDRLDWRCWSAPVFGWDHFTPPTSSISLSYAYIPQLMAGRPGSRFIDRFRDGQTGTGVVIARDEQGQLPDDVVMSIMLDAAFGRGAQYQFDAENNKLQVQTAVLGEAQRTLTLDMSPRMMENTLRRISDRITDRIGRDQSVQRQQFVALADFHRRGGDVTTLRATDLPNGTSLELARMVSLNYDLPVAHNMLAGEFVALHGEIADQLRDVNQVRPENRGGAVLRNAGVLAYAHVFGGITARRALVSNSWSGIGGAQDNNLMTRGGLPRDALRDRISAIANQTRAFEFLDAVGYTDAPVDGAPFDLRQSGFIRGAAQRAVTYALEGDETLALAAGRIDPLIGLPVVPVRASADVDVIGSGDTLSQRGPAL